MLGLFDTLGRLKENNFSFSFKTGVSKIQYSFADDSTSELEVMSSLKQFLGLFNALGRLKENNFSFLFKTGVSKIQYSLADDSTSELEVMSSLKQFFRTIWYTGQA